MSPAALGNGTLPRGPLHIPEGDDSWDPCLPSNCTLRCPRLPVSPPSLITHAVQVLSELTLSQSPVARVPHTLLSQGNGQSWSQNVGQDPLASYANKLDAVHVPYYIELVLEFLARRILDHKFVRHVGRRLYR